jgi:hypothetical protein
MHSAKFEDGKRTIKLSKSLNTGIDSAMIQAMTQMVKLIAIQVPVANKVR